MTHRESGHVLMRARRVDARCLSSVYVDPGRGEGAWAVYVARLPAIIARVACARRLAGACVFLSVVPSFLRARLFVKTSRKSRRRQTGREESSVQCAVSSGSEVSLAGKLTS